jgi:CelD/BcsL family acetyltransferase involved in cellulose biosynthesis
LAGQWKALQARTGHTAPFFGHGFLSCWLEAFAPHDRVRAVVVSDKQGLRAALVLVERETRTLGVRVRTLSGAANVHSARFDLVADPADAEAIQAIWEHLRADPSWEVIELPDVPVGEAALAAAPALQKAAEAQRFPVGQWASMQTPFIPLGAEPLLSRVGSKFRSNIRRRHRILSEVGPVHLERIEGGPELEARLEEGLALEASGWKGQEGTAINSQSATRAFYRSLAQTAATEGTLSLYQLISGTRPVAFHFGLAHEGIYYLPKMGFDEELSSCSPGQLILQEVAADLEKRGFRELDFLGPEMPWKREWTDHLRAHAWCYVFCDRPLGKMLHAAKFTVGPRVKEVLPWKH